MPLEREYFCPNALSFSGFVTTCGWRTIRGWRRLWRAGNRSLLCTFSMMRAGGAAHGGGVPVVAGQVAARRWPSGSKPRVGKLVLRKWRGG